MFIHPHQNGGPLPTHLLTQAFSRQLQASNLLPRASHRLKQTFRRRRGKTDFSKGFYPPESGPGYLVSAIIARQRPSSKPCRLGKLFTSSCLEGLWYRSVNCEAETRPVSASTGAPRL